MIKIVFFQLVAECKNLIRYADEVYERVSKTLFSFFKNKSLQG